jgi:ComF family protein
MRMTFMNNWPSIIQDWLFPPTCLLCGDPGAEGRDLCGACAEELPRNRPACPVCALPLPFADDLPCGRCLADPPAYARAVVPFHYAPPIDYLIRSLKFNARFPCARLLGQLLAEALAAETDRPHCIVPMPLHVGRYRARGYNQALEIAREVSRILAIPLDPQACARVLPTRPQTRLSGKERLRNVRKAFRASGAMNARHVAILDDVMTTGATVGELAQALRKAGAARVDVWAVARAGYDRGGG